MLLHNVPEFQLLVNYCQHFVLALGHGLTAAVRTKLDQMEVFSSAILSEIVSSFMYIKSVTEGSCIFLQSFTFSFRFLQSFCQAFVKST